MADDFDFVCDEITADVARAQQAYGEDLATVSRDRVSKPVGYKLGPRGGSVKIRSKPGEPPRRDTGRLMGSIRAESITVGDSTSTAVYTDVEYAPPLQNDMDRPIFAGELEATEALVLDMLAEAIDQP